MENIVIKMIENNEEKVQIMRKCDLSFPIRLFERSNCDEIIQRITNYACFYAAYLRGGDTGAIGYIAFYANDMERKIAYISNIGVDLEYQRKHIGSLLMKKCLDIAKSKGMSVLRLEVLSTNKEAIAFYRYWGFDFESQGEKDTFYMSRYL